MAFNPYESDRLRQAQQERDKEGFEVSCLVANCERCVRVPVQRIVSVEILNEEVAIVDATVRAPSDCDKSNCGSQAWGTVAINAFDIMWLRERVPEERIIDQI